jgi:hypothetical protein
MKMKAKSPYLRAAKSRVSASAVHVSHWSIAGVVLVIAMLLAVPFHALAQPASSNGILLAEDLVPAPEGYETVTAKYVTARPTDLYIGPFLWAGTVIGIRLTAGQQIEVLAKPKGYDWLLVGKNGAGIGYVPISVLSPVR